ncbi:MAG: hypothetical protein E7532_05975 [Ruminococcaceae bacterium]|nr:hypothetical protein [Oscillospiraceae bacterium]
MADFGKFYRAYMYMQELLQNDFTYNYITASLKDGDKGKDSLTGKTNEKVIDMDWVEAIEEALPYIQKAIDEQRRFIKQIENVVRIELARKTGPDSVKHLSQHTNFIAKVEGDMVTPNKILVTEQEESFAIYENRVLMTLIRRALHFVDDKYSKMKGVPNDSYNNIKVIRHAELDDKKVDFAFNYINESHESLADDLDVLDVSELSDFDRIRRIRTTLNEFLNTQLMREIAKEPEVHPPITQTNLLKKNPNFKKAMELWNFLDSYKRPGFEIVGEEFSGEMTEEVKEDVYLSMTFQHFMMSIATNPGLRRILHDKYEEENIRIAEENAKPEKLKAAQIQARIDEVRKEEMEIRLKEIREREKKILDLTNEVKNLKVTLDQKEQQILTLKGQVSALQDEIAELKAELQETKLKLLEAEKEIERLKEENAALKAEIAELKATIVELNNKIDELNAEIDSLKARIAELEEENARQKVIIKEQQLIIEQQTEKIAALEKQVAEQLAKITALTEHLERCEAEIAEKTQQITDLTHKNEVLTDTLNNERQEHKATVEKMTRDYNDTVERMTNEHKNTVDKLNSEHDATVQKMNEDFEKKTFAAKEKHKAEVKKLEATLDSAEAKHTSYVAKLNAEFAEKASKAESKRLKELAEKQAEFETNLANVKKANADATEAANAKHASEIRKVQKSVDKCVEAARKEAEKGYNAKVKELNAQHEKEMAELKRKLKEEMRIIKRDAKAEVKLAKKKARKNLFTEEELTDIED